MSALVKSLPKSIRRTLIPLVDSIDKIIEHVGAFVRDRRERERLVDVLASVVTELSGLNVTPDDFDRNAIPAHLMIHFVVSDDDGTIHDVGTDLTAIKDRLAGTVRASIAAAAPIVERRGITTWDLGDLAQVVEAADGSLGVTAYPTLLDVGDSVSLRVVTNPDLQRRVMRGGVRRLLLLSASPTRQQTERLLSGNDRLAIADASMSLATLSDDCASAAVDAVIARQSSLPWSAAAFDSLRSEVKRAAPTIAANAMERAVAVVIVARRVETALARLSAPAIRPSVDDANTHLGRLVRPGFVLSAGVDRLDDVHRYVRGIEYRLAHLAGSAERDRRRMTEVVPLEERYAAFVDVLGPARATSALADITWQLEELRVSIFAQPIGASGQVSAKRVAAALAAVGA